jgi:hypothetical protein
MTKAFKERVIRERIVDTKNYRYCVKECGDCMKIIRIPFNMLDYTLSCDIENWEVVEIIK